MEPDETFGSLFLPEKSVGIKNKNFKKNNTICKTKIFYHTCKFVRNLFQFVFNNVIVARENYFQCCAKHQLCCHRRRVFYVKYNKLRFF